MALYQYIEFERPNQLRFWVRKWWGGPSAHPREIPDTCPHHYNYVSGKPNSKGTASVESNPEFPT